MQNFYEILKINPWADGGVIKAAYRTLMFRCRCHPDLGGSEEMARQINEAYDTLRDPKKRERYNKTLNPEVFTPRRTGLGFAERRRIPRVNVNLNVSYKTLAGDPLPARVLDLSFLGCRIQTEAQLAEGSRLTININGHAVDGTVKWRRMFHPSVFQRIHEAGIEFEKEFVEIDEIN